jgi:hypothetical protein
MPSKTSPLIRADAPMCASPACAFGDRFHVATKTITAVPFQEGRGHTYYYKSLPHAASATEFPGLEVDNCELSAFSHPPSSSHKESGNHIHHSYIHHCQYADSATA